MGDSVFSPHNGLPSLNDRERLEAVDNASVYARSAAADRAERFTPIEEMYGQAPAHVLVARDYAAEYVAHTHRQLTEALKQSQRARAHAQEADIAQSSMRLLEAVDDLIEVARSMTQNAMGALTRLGDHA